MPNTNAEVMQAKNAVALIAKKYQTFLMGNRDLLALLGTPSIERLNNIIKYMDSRPFTTNFRTTFPAAERGERGNCVTNAFTTWDNQRRPTIFINRVTARAATAIHELLHLMTDRAFIQRFRARVDIIEGMTEYFTREVQGNTSARDRFVQFREFSATLSSRRGHYDEWTRTVRGIDRKKLDTIADKANVMEEAFFRGDRPAIDALAFGLEQPEIVNREATSMKHVHDQLRGRQ